MHRLLKQGQMTIPLHAAELSFRRPQGGRLARAATLVALGDETSLAAAQADAQTVLAAGSKEVPLADAMRAEATRLLLLAGTRKPKQHQ